MSLTRMVTLLKWPESVNSTCLRRTLITAGMCKAQRGETQSYLPCWLLVIWTFEAYVIEQMYVIPVVFCLMWLSLAWVTQSYHKYKHLMTFHNSSKWPRQLISQEWLPQEWKTYIKYPINEQNIYCFCVLMALWVKLCIASGQVRGAADGNCS